VERVAVVGSPGSGKTTLGRQLASLLDVPFVELDSLHHRPQWQEATTAELRAAVADGLAGPHWVVDGNYRKVADLTQMRADTIVWLDLSRMLVTWRVLRRSLVRVVRRQRLWHGNRESLRRILSRDPERSIVVWTWQQHPKYRARYEAQMNESIWARAHVVRLRSRGEVRAWSAGVGRSPDAAAADAR
jgi:adenylate kinase family enzyme